ncbi:hypothetical protein FRC10_007146 [Ceratobasidium sp. 414]|nr:hypothetical protein FRC10_007146 [Ceratobasidium sp. 414]
MQPYTTPNDITASLFQWHADMIIKKYYHRLGLDTGTFETIEDSGSDEATPPIDRIAVIGAGVSGLQVALKLGSKYKVDVFEASDHVGGRLYTYRFDHVPGAGEWDYFDVGAMRFPRTSVMTPTYDLFRDLNIPLLDYHMTTKESWMYYNNIRVQRGDATGQDFGASISKGGNVPDEWAKIGHDELMRNVYKRFLDALKANYKKGYEELMEYDNHSTRSLMAFVTLPEIKDPATGGVLYPKKDLYPVEVINWLETMTFSVGWFDRAFSETILELLAFAEGDSKVVWKCVDKGSENITKAMEAKLKQDPYRDNVNFFFCHQTTAVVFDPDSKTFTLSGKLRPGQNCGGFDKFPETKHSQVVLAISPQAMRYLDLSTCELDYGQRSALLTLQPGLSTKVGIKFKRNWWADQHIIGGQCTTDRPVRTVVYPSHGDGKSTVLIASYCWSMCGYINMLPVYTDRAIAQDAAAIGALMQGEDSFDEERLKNAFYVILPISMVFLWRISRKNMRPCILSTGITTPRPWVSQIIKFESGSNV